MNLLTPASWPEVGWIVQATWGRGRSTVLQAQVAVQPERRQEPITADAEGIPHPLNSL